MISIPDSMAAKYQSSVNSVVYFFSLPYGLNDLSVKKELVGSKSIGGEDHYKIKVWFDEQAGEDHEDVYYYWIDKDSFHINYLAYSFQVDGGGMRFREAYNPRSIHGIRVVDYINYQPMDGKLALSKIDDAFADGKLNVLSRIENDNVTISLLSE